MPDEDKMTDEAIANSPVESSPTSLVSEETTTVDEKPVNQEAVNKRFNDITAQKYEQKNRADVAEQRIKELETQLYTPAPAGIVQAEIPQPAMVPPSPDLFYEDPEQYNQEMADYQGQIASQAIAKQYESTQAATRQRAETELLQSQQAETQRKMIENASTHNIELAELDKSAIVLGQRGINQQLTDLIMTHEAGAPLLDHLAKNPGDFDQINNLRDPISIIRALDGLQSQALERNISTAPAPIDTLTGLPAREGDTFSKRLPNAVIK